MKLGIDSNWPKINQGTPLYYMAWVYNTENAVKNTLQRLKSSSLLFHKGKKTLKTSNRWGDLNSKSLKEFYFSKMYHRHIFLLKVYLPFLTSYMRLLLRRGSIKEVTNTDNTVLLETTSRHLAYVIWKLYYTYLHFQSTLSC